MKILLRRLPQIFLSLFFLAGGDAIAQTAGFTMSPTAGCSPLSVSFTNTSTGTITSYYWDLGNGNFSTLQNASATYTSPGTYYVSLTATGPSGSNTYNDSVVVYDKPSGTFSGTNTAGCAPLATNFSASITANAPGSMTYSWDFGDGNSLAGTASGSTFSTAHTYSTPGTYTVTLYVTNSAGCLATIIQTAYVTAYAVPNPAFSAAQTLYCATPASVTFANSSTGGTAPFTTSWTFGDAGTGTGNTPTHVYTSSGLFTVTMTVTDAHGCSSTAVLNNYISVQGAPATFSVPTSACKDALVTFNNTTSGAPGALWNFGDGNSSTGSTTTHVYTTAGTYTVTMTVSINGCQKTATQTITVQPNPTPTITQSPSVPCPKPSTVAFSATASAATSWYWNFGNGQTATTQNAAVTYNANGLYTVKVVATTAAGCMDSMRIDSVLVRDIIVKVNPESDAAHPYSGCAPLPADFSVGLFTYDTYPPLPPMSPPAPYPFGPVAWQWDFGDGTAVGTSATPHHVYTSLGNYTVRCIITTPNGCTDTGYSWIHVDTAIRPSFYAVPTSACVKSPVTFINTTTGNDIHNTAYTWFLGDTTISFFDTFRVRRLYSTPDIYNVFLASNHGGCLDTAYRYSYITVNPPNASFKDSVFCPPSLKANFINNSISATSQLWKFGDGTSDTSRSPTHIFPDTGMYNVMLTTYNSTFGCRDTLVRRVELHKNTANFTISDSLLCTGHYATVHGTWTGNGTPGYSYIFDNYQTAFDTTSSDNFYRFDNRGRFDVTMVVRSGPNFACIDSVKKPNLVLVSRPLVNIGASPRIGCQPLAVTFTDSSTNTPGVPNVYRHWEFGQGPGDSLTTTTVSVSRTYPYRGVYSVSITVTDSLGCFDTLHLGNYIEVRKPTAKFGVSIDTACAFQLVSFTDSSYGANAHLAHLWIFGDGTTATTDSARHRYATPGVYTPRLIVTDSTGCSDTAIWTRTVVIRAPHASFTQSDTLAICPPLLIRFTNTSTGVPTLSYLWDFGTGGTPVIVTNPSYSYATAGLYHPRLVVTDRYGCTDTATGTVRVLGYNGAFSYTPLSGCAPLAVQFTATVTNIPRITWDFADGATTTTLNASTTSHTYATAGAYMPKVIFSDASGGCTSSSLGLDTIKVDKLNAHFRFDPACVGLPLTFYDSSYARFGAPNSIKWGFGPGDSASGTPVTHTWTVAGNKTVTLTVRNAFGCTATETRNDVPVYDLPYVDAGPDSTGVCPGDTAILTATGAVSYVWSPAADLLDPTANPAQATRTPGKYFVVGTDAHGCINVDSIRTVIQIKTTSSVGAGGEICAGDTFRLHAEGAQKYSWTPAEYLDSANIASPLARPVATTTFTVAAQKGTCLIDYQKVTVVVHPTPFFDAGPDEIIALGSGVTLKPTGVASGIQSIVWRKDSTLITTDPFQPLAKPYYTTTYYAVATDQYGCSDSDTVVVHVRCNGSLTFIPNTFTPNGDGQNDVFYARGSGIRRMISFRIYNRWGEVVFDRTNAIPNDPTTGWDGTFKGQPLAPDTYFYSISTHCDSGELVTFKGDITLVR